LRNYLAAVVKTVIKLLPLMLGFFVTL